MKKITVLIFIANVFFCGLAFAETLKQGVNNVKIISGDGLAGYQDIISGKRPTKIQISAKLYLPEKCEGKKFPAVIIQHGSGDPTAAFYEDTAQALNEKGIVALVPNSFSARNMSSTGKHQSQLSKATRIYDTFSAFGYLQGLDCVDATPAGITG